MDMAGRMTVCNMSIEAGARAGLIAPDETTFDYLKGRAFAPKGEAFEQAVAYWRTLPTDPGAHYDRGCRLTHGEIAPMVTWGTSPEAVIPITGVVPIPADEPDERSARRCSACWNTWALSPGQRPTGPAGRRGVHRLLHQRPDRGHPRRRRGRQGPQGGRRGAGAGGAGLGLVKRQAEQRASTASCSRPASNGASRAARCAWA